MSQFLDIASRAELRAELAQVLVAAVLLVAGLAALGFAVVRRRAGDLALVAFGLLCALYGLRLAAETALVRTAAGAPPLVWGYLGASLTYLIPIPCLLFVEANFGRGWRSSMRLLLAVQIAYAVAAIAVDVARGPGAAMAPNGFLVIILIVASIANLVYARAVGYKADREQRAIIFGSLVLGAFALSENLAGEGLLPWRVGPEYLGMLAFVGCLGWAVAHRLVTGERRLSALTSELEAARQIQAAILPRRTPEVPGLAIAARYVPMVAVGGDLYDFLGADGRRVGVLVADVAGHGVAAALVASMVKIAASSQLAAAHDPATVLAGMSRMLRGNVSRGFVTASYLFLDPAARTARWAAAGHPPPLLWRAAERRVVELRGEGVPLGRLPAAVYASSEVALAPGDRLVLYTDGVVEAPGAGGEPFGDERLAAFVAAHGGAPGERFADALLAELARWTGRERAEAFDDDVTFVVVDVEGPAPAG